MLSGWLDLVTVTLTSTIVIGIAQIEGQRTNLISPNRVFSAIEERGYGSMKRERKDCARGFG